METDYLYRNKKVNGLTRIVTEREAKKELKRIQYNNSLKVVMAKTGDGKSIFKWDT